MVGGVNQEEVDERWMRVAKKIEVENSKREACRGRGAPLEWRLKQEIPDAQMERTAGQGSFLCRVQSICSESKACRKVRRRRKI